MVKLGVKITIITGAFIVICLSVGAFLWVTNWKYERIILKGDYLSFPTEIGLVPIDDRNPITNDPIVIIKTISLYCEACQCDPAGYVDICLDKESNIFWIKEYELGLGTAQVSYYGPFENRLDTRLHLLNKLLSPGLDLVSIESIDEGLEIYHDYPTPKRLIPVADNKSSRDYCNPITKNPLYLDTSSGGEYMCCEVPTFYVYIDSKSNVLWIQDYQAGIGYVNQAWYGPFVLE
ncbi:hypothetical protein JW962_00495 [Candidatus Dojkabacteria bacterium]|nr:hypothetical protein [Candidatus Dojkabacteria bacterium]